MEGLWEVTAEQQLWKESAPSEACWAQVDADPDPECSKLLGIQFPWEPVNRWVHIFSVVLGRSQGQCSHFWRVIIRKLLKHRKSSRQFKYMCATVYSNFWHTVLREKRWWNNKCSTALNLMFFLACWLCDLIPCSAAISEPRQNEILYFTSHADDMWAHSQRAALFLPEGEQSELSPLREQLWSRSSQERREAALTYCCSKWRAATSSLTSPRRLLHCLI